MGIQIADGQLIHRGRSRHGLAGAIDLIALLKPARGVEAEFAIHENLPRLNEPADLGPGLLRELSPQSSRKGLTGKFEGDREHVEDFRNSGCHNW